MTRWMRRTVGSVLVLGAWLALSLPASAQFGHPLFAYVEIPALDNSGRPLINGETGERLTEGICAAWPSTAGRDQGVQTFPADRLVKSAHYVVDVPHRTVVVDRVRMRNTIATPETIPLGARGWMLAGPPEELTVSVNITARLYDSPQPGWKCNDDNWRRAVAGFRYTPPSPGAVGDSDLARGMSEDMARRDRAYAEESARKARQYNCQQTTGNNCD
jgi:hypothetical protein